MQRTRALPITPLMVQGLAGAAYALQNVSFAAALLVGYVCLLRTGEVLKLQFSDIIHYGASKGTLIILRGTKTGQRFNITEKVWVHDKDVINALHIARQVGRGPKLFPGTAAQFNNTLRDLGRRVGLPTHQLTGYALRRGGATWHFLMYGHLGKTTVHGRWGQEKTARIYIDGALAQQTEYALSKSSRRVLETGASVAKDLLRCPPGRAARLLAQ